MNRTLTLLTALGAGLALAPFVAAQAPAAPAAAAPAPVAMDAKIALVNFEQVVLASNEGQVVTANTQKKFEPKKNEIEKLAADVDGLKKQASAPAITDEAKAKLLREIDTKEKELNHQAEDAQTAYNAEWQEGLAGVAQKIAGTMKKYAADSGFTLLLDVSSQQSNVLWAVPQTDISQAVVDLYNKQSGIAAPPPPSPSASKPATAAPRPAAPKPAAPKQ